jgi:hypothetical protein
MPSIYIVLERKIPGVDTHVNGSYLSKNSDQLEQLAIHLGVKPLMAFFSTSPEEVADLIGEDHISHLPQAVEQWFRAQDGLATVDALLANLSKAQFVQVDRVELELKEWARLLQLARSKETGWHLAVDY